MNNVTFYGRSDTGRKRTNNEDAYVIENIWDDDHILAVAIDGVGGYEGGEVAAAIAQKSIPEYLRNFPNGERVELLKQAVIYANDAIYAQRQENPELSSMSCVLTAALIEVKNRRINMAHVGDTRLYELYNGQYKKLSHDHSLVGYREEVGDLTEEEAMRHPQRNIISRDVGSKLLQGKADDYIETNTFSLHGESSLLLCSDGLCDMVTSLQMRAVLEQNISTEEKVEALIQAANNAGGKDNITVVIVETHFKDEPKGNEEAPLKDEEENPYVRVTPIDQPITADPDPLEEDDSNIVITSIDINKKDASKPVIKKTATRVAPPPSPTISKRVGPKEQPPQMSNVDEPLITITPINPSNRKEENIDEEKSSKLKLTTNMLVVIALIASVAIFFSGYFVGGFNKTQELNEEVKVLEPTTPQNTFEESQIPVLSIESEAVDGQNYHMIYLQLIGEDLCDSVQNLDTAKIYNYLQKMANDFQKQNIKIKKLKIVEKPEENALPEEYVEP